MHLSESSRKRIVDEGTDYAVGSVLANQKSGVKTCFLHYPGTGVRFRTKRHRRRFEGFDEAVKRLQPRAT